MNGNLLSGDRLLILFKSHWTVRLQSPQWLLRRDPRDRLRFAPFESPQGDRVLARHGIASCDSQSSPSTILAVRDYDLITESAHTRSDAVLTILHELTRPWPAVAAVLRLIPRPLRDLGYWLVARSRYRIWGRLENCPIPGAKERARFL